MPGASLIHIARLACNRPHRAHIEPQPASARRAYRTAGTRRILITPSSELLQKLPGRSNLLRQHKRAPPHRDNGPRWRWPGLRARIHASCASSNDCCNVRVAGPVKVPSTGERTRDVGRVTIHHTWRQSTANRRASTRRDSFDSAVHRRSRQRRSMLPIVRGKGARRADEPSHQPASISNSSRIPAFCKRAWPAFVRARGNVAGAPHERDFDASLIKSASARWRARTSWRFPLALRDARTRIAAYLKLSQRVTDLSHTLLAPPATVRTTPASATAVWDALLVKIDGRKRGIEPERLRCLCGTS